MLRTLVLTGALAALAAPALAEPATTKNTQPAAQAAAQIETTATPGAEPTEAAVTNASPSAAPTERAYTPVGSGYSGCSWGKASPTS